ncbi:WD40-repeat-containing domain protein [Fimicolochytrium jonesii]|uniref:WD40-repeat-containing domain protein n=1 Tax=Fimicolochytrium jonesii TaxID=1396493 RepID=UPI0022FE9A18|nr:WD40-repeat-containing domain protein [Fimicolochytrium jonesii]KAI8823056.1 WD40-repeat-containing domain protein [Fimicolochytrium jonesii]
MNEVKQFSAGHDDLIHDVAYDFYGKRLATCSSDQKIKVWDYDDETGEWLPNDSWKGHDSSVLRITWAHPEYGQVFATCSIDRTIRVWEEQDQEAKNGGRRWAEKARLADSKGTVQDIKFAPTHLGLKFASCGADGIVRMYEAMDVMQLGHWTLMDDIEVVPGAKDPEGQMCLSWCPSRFQPQMLAVGHGFMLTHASPTTTQIYRLDPHNKWLPHEVLTGHTDVVTDVAWAPNVGRSYQLIATACKDKCVRIFKLVEEGGRGTTGAAGFATGFATKAARKFRVLTVATFSDHAAEVWRVEWNVTGTVLSSSGDDGKVRLWKASFLDEWRCMSIISAEQNTNDFGENAMR